MNGADPVGAPPRPRRPAGVTLIGTGLVLAGLAFLCWSAQAALRGGAGLLAPGVLPVFLAMGVLPGVWALAAGVGMLRGRNWARAAFYALAALTVVVTAGVLSRPLEAAGAKMAAGACVSVFLLAGWGVWYLRGSGADGWFR